MSKVLGVLGGMGPAATLDFLTKLQAHTPAQKDQDHIRVIVDINPHVPDQSDPFSKPGPVLAEMAGALRGAGAEVLAIACNSAHAYADLISRSSGLPLIDMIATASQAARQTGARRAGVLALHQTADEQADAEEHRTGEHHAEVRGQHRVRVDAEVPRLGAPLREAHIREDRYIEQGR